MEGKPTQAVGYLILCCLQSCDTTYLGSISRAFWAGASNLLVTSSLTRSLQHVTKHLNATKHISNWNNGMSKALLLLPFRAPARPSRVTCQEKASPCAFSSSSSFADRGKALRHRSNRRGKWCFMTDEPLHVNRWEWENINNVAVWWNWPRVITAPRSVQPACVFASDNRLFWRAVRSRCSARWNTS